MCGISFIWARNPQNADLSTAIRTMCSSQRHRGPDAFAERVLGDSAIGHTRLRILDLSPASDQPFHIDPFPYHLSYNGEIYNYRELRSELSTRGVRFRTTSDTEVLYQALALWGHDALARLQGMFAFAWYDEQTTRLLVARDHLGIKPLFVHSSPDVVLVASEAKAIFASGFIKPAWDHTALYQILKYNHPLSCGTPWRGIRSLPPGSWEMIELRSGRHSSGTYWNVRFTDTASSRFADRVDEFDARFCGAIRSHLLADVPVSTFLSGGLDSTGIAAEGLTQGAQPITAYTMALPGLPYNEGPLARRVSATLGLKSVEIPIARITWDEYAGYIRAAEMPQWWTTDLSIKLLCRGVQTNGSRVVLSGEGPDEFLAGYDSYRFMKIRDRLAQFGLHRLPFGKLMDRLKPRRLGLWYPLDTSLINSYFSAHHPHRDGLLREFYGFHPENVMTWEMMTQVGLETMHHDVTTRLDDLRQEERVWYGSQIAPAVKGLSALHANLYYEITTRLPNWILAMSDRMSSAHGIELRLPYLDRPLVDFMLSLPETDRLHGMTEKYILRHVHRRRIPASVAYRRKQPLYTPAFDWLRPLCYDERFPTVWSRQLFDEVGFLDFSACELVRRRLLNGEYRTELERLTHEWMFGYAFSLHLLASEMK